MGGEIKEIESEHIISTMEIIYTSKVLRVTKGRTQPSEARRRRALHKESELPHRKNNPGAKASNINSNLHEIKFCRIKRLHTNPIVTRVTNRVYKNRAEEFA